MTTTPLIPLAIPDDQVGRLIGIDVDANTRARLRRKGQFPPCFYVGGKTLVLVADIDAFLAERRAAADAERARKSERMTRTINARWDRVRTEKAAAEAQS
jgi:hypothetical protein